MAYAVKGDRLTVTIPRSLIGLTVSYYPLVKNYPAQPDFRLIDGLLLGSQSVATLTVDGLGYTADMGLLYEGYVKVSETDHRGAHRLCDRGRQLRRL